MGKTRYAGPRRYFSYRDQRRLLALVFMLMLVLVLMMEAGKPANWQWLWGHRSLDNQGASGGPSRVNDPHQPTSKSGSATGNLEYVPGIDQEDFAKLQDDRVFLPSESDIWYRWLSILHDIDEDELQTVSVDPVGFLTLNRQTAEYRGRRVAIAGTIRRAHYIEAPDNPQQIRSFWQCWLFTDEVGHSPIVVYSLEMPEGFPQGMQLDEPVRFSGLVYKRWAYQAEDALRVAPVVMAKRGVWIGSTAGEGPRPIRLPALLLVVAVAAVMGVGAACIAFFKRP